MEADSLQMPPPLLTAPRVAVYLDANSLLTFVGQPMIL